MTEPGLITDHAAAIKALLSLVSFTDYDGAVPDLPSYPYYVLFTDTGIDAKTKVCGQSDEMTFRFQITSVGLTADAVRIVAGAVRAAVLDARPVVAGRSSVNKVRKETGIPIREDKDVTLSGVNRHPLFAVDTYVFESRKD